MAVEVCFFGGAGDDEKGELGGVQGLFDDKGLETKFLLDIGQRPDHFSRYYSFPYRPKSFQFLQLSEQLEFQIPMKDLSRHDLEAIRGNKVGEVPIDGVLATHVHYDHIGGISFLRYDVPFYVPKLGMKVLYVWQQTSGTTLNQFCDLHYTALVRNLVGGEKFMYGEEAIFPRDIRVFDDNERFRVGNMDINSFLVDHSLPGSSGFVAETSVGDIGISGDIRKRGLHPEHTENFVQNLQERDIRYLFWEGSLLHFDHEGSEGDVANAIADICKKHTFVAIAYPPRDLDRITSIYRAAKASGRMLVVNSAQASMMQLLDGANGYPRLNWKYIGVCLPRKMHGIIDLGFDDSLVKRDYFTRERKYLDWSKWGDDGEHKGKAQRVGIDDIKNNQDQFLVFMPLNLMPDMLIEIKPQPNSIYIRSHPGPWTTEMEIQENHQIEFLKEFGMYHGPQPDVLTPSIEKKMCQVHVTGHLNRRETRETLQRLISAHPKMTVLPYHCMYPQDFPTDVAKGAREVYIPKFRENITLTKDGIG